MNKISFLRLFTYTFIIAIVIISRRRIGVIPIHLFSDEDAELLRSEPERRKADYVVVSSAGFKDARLSGSHVVAIAEAKARERGEELKGFLPPEIRLSVIDGKILWVVHYAAFSGPV